MEQEEFLCLVESMGTEPDDDAFERLADELATRQAWEILAFEDQLASAFYDWIRATTLVPPAPEETGFSTSAAPPSPPAVPSISKFSRI